MLTTIKDEDATSSRPSHLDIRLQIFGDRYPKETLLTVDPRPEVKEANRLFRLIFTDRSLLEMTAAVGGIEEWYVPIAAMLEDCYLRLGYTTRQVETYSLHKTADRDHSTAAIAFVGKYAHPEREGAILKSVEDAFSTTSLYDLARFRAATDRTRGFESYLRK